MALWLSIVAFPAPCITVLQSIYTHPFFLRQKSTRQNYNSHTRKREITTILLHDVGGLKLGVALKLVQPEIGQLNDPARVYQAIRRGEGAVKFYDGLVKINHALRSAVQKNERKFIKGMSAIRWTYFELFSQDDCVN